VKKVKNAVLYDDGYILVSNIRFSYPHLAKKYKGKNDSGTPKFGIVGLLPKDTHREAKKLLEGEIERVLKEAKVRAIPADKKFLRDGDESDKDGYPGNWTISAREDRRPICRDENNEIIEVEDLEEKIQGGFWGSVLIEPWWQNNDFGKRVNASLRAVRVKREDETFGKARISEEEAEEAFAEDDEDEDERPARKKGGGSRYEDEDEAPRRRRPKPADDDDDDDL
jgi:hypothetical protein